jgi:hypothetical protein
VSESWGQVLKSAYSLHAIPPEFCNGTTVLSLIGNNATYLPTGTYLQALIYRPNISATGLYPLPEEGEDERDAAAADDDDDDETLQLAGVDLSNRHLWAGLLSPRSLCGHLFGKAPREAVARHA